MDYKYIIDSLNRISQDSIALTQQGYNPAYNVGLMMFGIQKLIQTIQDEMRNE